MHHCEFEVTIIAKCLKEKKYTCRKHFVVVVQNNKQVFYVLLGKNGSVLSVKLLNRLLLQEHPYQNLKAKFSQASVHFVLNIPVNNYSVMLPGY